jgi:hypothetical protein
VPKETSNGSTHHVALTLNRLTLAEWLDVFLEPSYLNQIPSYYESSLPLCSVVKCTMAQYKRAMQPEAHVRDIDVLRLYGKALKELQVALNDERQCLQPDSSRYCCFLLFEVCKLSEMKYVLTLLHER